MRSTRSRARGSTVVEVLMAISVLAIGATGVIALQKTTTVANRDARHLEVANEIARTWIERLRGDALLWNHPSDQNPTSDQDLDTVWLRTTSIADPGAEAWVRPDNGTIHGVHDAMGNDDISGNLQGPYCVNLRLTWLRQPSTTLAGWIPGLVRAEIRVYWLRHNLQTSAGLLSMTPPAELCGATPAAPPDADSARDVFHVVHVVTALGQNQTLE